MAGPQSNTPNIPNESSISFTRVQYRLSNNRVLLSGLDLEIAAGEITMLLGRSGSGKTTCLKLINRLLVPTQGEVRVQGVATTQWDPISLRRHIGYAIQDVGLFPHYTVEQNVGLVPRLERWEGKRVRARVQDVLELVRLPASEFAKRYPDELSGGQRQRVGLARALAADPPVLLMDEPFGALDPLGRIELQQEFKALQQRLRKTVVFVTHDVSEALLLADHIALLQDGQLLGVYTPREFASSDNPEVRGYMDAFRSAQQVLA
ncbi:MAG TPA: ATP-binding cassette domain-containing protein [Terriglobales bacterium]